MLLAQQLFLVVEGVGVFVVADEEVAAGEAEEDLDVHVAFLVLQALGVVPGVFLELFVLPGEQVLVGVLDVFDGGGVLAAAVVVDGGVDFDVDFAVGVGVAAELGWLGRVFQKRKFELFLDVRLHDARTLPLLQLHVFLLGVLTHALDFFRRPGFLFALLALFTLFASFFLALAFLLGRKQVIHCLNFVSVFRAVDKNWNPVFSVFEFFFFQLRRDLVPQGQEFHELIKFFLLRFFAFGWLGDLL